MSGPAAETVFYKRSRFSTRLPVDRLYTGAHYWLQEESPVVWKVGFTKFATRMLGDLVEYGFSIYSGDRMTVGYEIGSIEGFKAVSTIFSVAEGEFLGSNDDIRSDITLIESDPYGRGWLYRVRGDADPGSTDVQGYVSILDATVDRLIQSRYAGGKQDDES